MKVSDLLALVEMKSVPKGRNLDYIGWLSGYLVVVFKGRMTKYVYGPNVAEVERDKIIRTPYPDSLFNKLKAKHDWQCLKVERDPSKSV